MCRMDLPTDLPMDLPMDLPTGPIPSSRRPLMRWVLLRRPSLFIGGRGLSGC